MDGQGSFSNQLVYIGSLIQGDIHHLAPFFTRDAKTNLFTRFLAYTGNRVNIYVMDQISLATRIATAGLKMGIYVSWGFKAYMEGTVPLPAPAGYPICKLREADWNGATPVVGTFLNQVNPLRDGPSETELFMESKIEFGSYVINQGGIGGTGNNAPTSLQLGDLAQNLYTFPYGNWLNVGRNYCIPVVARADFMEVGFWCEPSTFVGLLPTDQIHVWALAGSDAGGSQRIGGGQG